MGEASVIITSIMALARNIVSLVAGILFIVAIVYGIMALWKWYKCGNNDD